LKTVYIIGDSHAEGLGWASESYKSDTLKVVSQRIKAKTAWNLHFEIEELICPQDKDFIVMPTLGEVDVRFHLAAKKNTETVVSNYVERTVNAFPNNEVRFLTPNPPSQIELIPNEYKGSLEERLEIYDEFVSHLDSFSSKYGLKAPVAVQEAIGIFPIPNEYYRWDGYHMDHPGLLKILKHIDLKVNNDIIEII
jgi:hypothetical protein